MATKIPSAAEVLDRVSALSPAQIQTLAGMSGVPVHTLAKLRSGETANPRIETVHLIWPHLAAASRVTA